MSSRERPGTIPLLTPEEVGTEMHVKPMTVAHWARTGKLRSIRTPGNHRRYAEDDITRIKAGEDPREVYRTSALAGMGQS